MPNFKKGDIINRRVGCGEANPRCLVVAYVDADSEYSERYILSELSKGIMFENNANIVDIAYYKEDIINGTS